MSKENGRFRIITSMGDVLAKFCTLAECVKWGNDHEPTNECEYVLDTQEDMEVPLEEVMKAFDDGEAPLDLYHF